MQETLPGGEDTAQEPARQARGLGSASQGSRRAAPAWAVPLREDTVLTPSPGGPGGPRLPCRRKPGVRSGLGPGSQASESKPVPLPHSGEGGFSVLQKTEAQGGPRMPQWPGTGLLPTIVLRKIQTLLEVDAESSTERAGQASRKAQRQASLSPTEGPPRLAPVTEGARDLGSQGLLLPCVQKTWSWHWRPLPPRGSLQKACSCPPPLFPGGGSTEGWSSPSPTEREDNHDQRPVWDRPPCAHLPFCNPLPPHRHEPNSMASLRIERAQPSRQPGTPRAEPSRAGQH